MKDIELRFNKFNLVKEDEDTLTVSGYVNEVGKWSHQLGSRKKFKERIMPGAFTKALATNSDIHFLAEHDANKILASTRNNSLKLIEDEKGLFMRAKISPTSYGRDYHTLIKDGILRNMSFGFKVLNDSWRKLNDGTYIREIKDLALFEVSVVSNPAYPQSTISARGLNLIDTVEIPDEVEVIEEREENTQESQIVEQQNIDATNVIEEPTNVVEGPTNTTESKTSIDTTTPVENEVVDNSKVEQHIDLEFLKKQLKQELLEEIQAFNKKEEVQQKIEETQEVEETQKVEEVQEVQKDEEVKEETELLDNKNSESSKDLTKFYKELLKLK